MFKELIARIKLRCLFNLGTFNEPLDNALNDLINKGIKSLKENEHRGVCVFKNGVQMMYWNANKYYGWLGEGHIRIRDEESPILNWSDSKVKASTMVRFLYAIDNYVKKEINSTNPKSE